MHMRVSCSLGTTYKASGIECGLSSSVESQLGLQELSHRPGVRIRSHGNSQHRLSFKSLYVDFISQLCTLVNQFEVI